MKALLKNVFWAITTLLLIAFIFSFFYAEQKQPAVLSIDQLVSKINSGEISKIIVNGNNLEIELKNNDKAVSKKKPRPDFPKLLKITAWSRPLFPGLIWQSKKNRVSVSGWEF